MDWLEAVVHTTTMGADIVSEVLMNAGAIGTAIEDRYDVTSSKKSDGMWDMIDEDVLKHMSEDVLVKAYFKSDASAPETLHLVEQKLGEIARMDMGFDMGSLELDTQGVREQDWAENWKKYYKPFRAGEHLVIKPSWEAYEPKEGDLVLELDPGMAFGTGTHETTFMCMEQLEKYITPGCRAIDVGCGSGILGLAAAKLGASDVLAIDLDELAVKVAAENTEKNGLSDIVRVAHGDLLEKRDEKAITNQPIARPQTCGESPVCGSAHFCAFALSHACACRPLSSRVFSKISSICFAARSAHCISPNVTANSVRNGQAM